MSAYRFKEASCINLDANVAGAVCERLEAEGRLTPKELVNVSRPNSAPLHDAFEWRDDVAAEKYREHQGRHIITNLVIVHEPQKPAETVTVPIVRAFEAPERNGESYRSITAVMSNEDLRSKLLAQAHKDALAFRTRYAKLEEFAKVIAAIDALHSA